MSSSFVALVAEHVHDHRVHRAVRAASHRHHLPVPSPSRLRAWVGRFTRSKPPVIDLREPLGPPRSDRLVSGRAVASQEGGQGVDEQLVLDGVHPLPQGVDGVVGLDGHGS